MKLHLFGLQDNACLARHAGKKSRDCSSADSKALWFLFALRLRRVSSFVQQPIQTSAASFAISGATWLYKSSVI